MGSNERVVAVSESNGKCGRLKVGVKNRQAQSAVQQVVKLTFGYVGYEPNMHERETHARRPRHVRGFLAEVAGIVGRWLHFGRRVGRGRRAMAFPAISLPHTL